MDTPGGSSSTSSGDLRLFSAVAVLLILLLLLLLLLTPLLLSFLCVDPHVSPAGAVSSYCHWLPGVGPQDHPQVCSNGIAAASTTTLTAAAAAAAAATASFQKSDYGLGMSGAIFKPGLHPA
jgi:hypothetical protein